MRSLLLAYAIVMTASIAAAGVPPMTLPDLTFPTPAPAPDISTQGCGAGNASGSCAPAR